MSGRLSPYLLAAVGCLVWSGCAASAVYYSKNYSCTGKVALLPIANNTNDLDAPPFIRQLLLDGLNVRGFQILPPDATDAALKSQGFTDGGQLRAASPTKLGEWTGTDLLFYPTLQSFDYINVGYYWQRRVTVEAKLVDARSGEKLWQAERSFSTRWVVTTQKEAEVQFTIQLAAKAVEKMTHRPLQQESMEAVHLLLETLPSK